MNLCRNTLVLLSVFSVVTNVFLDDSERDRKFPKRWLPPDVGNVFSDKVARPQIKFQSAQYFNPVNIFNISKFNFRQENVQPPEQVRVLAPRK
jgi:hypothetical protein